MEKIKKYVERFFKGKKQDINYEMSFNESKAGINAVISSADANSAFDVITTFFNFSYAKGYRAAMAEMKKGGAA